jgi:hypothetical protein
MNTRLSSGEIKEEQIVAELALLGVTYLSRLTGDKAASSRDACQMFVDLVHQPSSRVRTAVIALLLEHPEFAEVIPSAVNRLRATNRTVLKLFYTAAVYLQYKYADLLQEIQGKEIFWLPDLYSSELGIPIDISIDERLKELGLRQQTMTGKIANWNGTYDNVARHFIRHRQLEIQWNQ